MLRSIKNALYFSIARYFRFFAGIKLRRWNPRIVVITGSNGKTTALNLIEVQLGTAARYSHGANSSFGIPFNILGLERKSYSIWEWPLFALLAPIYAFGTMPSERIYIVEADCDRPYEGKFLSALLKPEVVVWLSSGRTHSMNFDGAVRRKQFARVEDAIAYEFGYFLKGAKKLAIVNADEPLIMNEVKRTSAAVEKIQSTGIGYAVGVDGAQFLISGTSYHAPYLLPQEVGYAVAASVKVAEYFGKQPTNNLLRLAMPPGRSSVFKGMKNTTIIDSTYNANADSVGAILHMVAKLSGTKWLILGDLIEQGMEEKEEHEKVAHLVQEADFKRIILVGPRMKRYALPLINDAVGFNDPKEALEYLQQNIQGNETLIFKGARFLEGVVEHLLADENDAVKLCRREAVWVKRRAQWGL
jgi:UDP-N-acetylmuramoyl-tripeptide--D-alanyl-D-alanine ligase